MALGSKLEDTFMLPSLPLIGKDAVVKAGAVHFPDLSCMMWWARTQDIAIKCRHGSGVRQNADGEGDGQGRQRRAADACRTQRQWPGVWLFYGRLSNFTVHKIIYWNAFAPRSWWAPVR